MTLCHHNFEHIATIYRGETQPGDWVQHTAVELFGCRACRTVDAFPASNAALLTPGYVQRLARELAAGGWVLPAGITWHWHQAPSEPDPYLLGWHPTLCAIAKQVCHEHGLPWTDPRTLITYPPPTPGRSPLDGDDDV